MAAATLASALASALATSSFNVGTAVGFWIAGLALQSALGTTGPVVVGAIIAALYFIPLSLLVVKDRRAALASAANAQPAAEPAAADA